MSEELEKVCVIALHPTEDGGLRLQVDAEYETDPDKRREIELEVMAAAVTLLQAVADDVTGKPFTVESMRWVPERLQIEHEPAQSAAVVACDPVVERGVQ